MGKIAGFSKKNFTGEAIYVLAIAMTGLVLVTSTFATRVAFFARHVGKSETNIDLIKDVEMMDRLIWLAILVLAGWFFLSAFRMRPQIGEFQPLRPKTEVMGIGTLLLGVLWVEPLSDYSGMWFGFGNQVFLTTVLATPSAIWFATRANEHVIKVVGWTSTAWILFAYIPLAIQPLWGIADPHHSRYIYNEIVGPMAGALALADFVPQYTTLMGLPLVVLSLFAIPSTPAALGLAISLYLSFLAILTLGLMIFIGRKMLPSRYKILAPLLIIPIALVKSQPPTTDTGAITTMLSAVPVRTLPLVLIATGLLYAVNSRSPWSRILLGFGLGLAVVNNFEFGLVCTIACLLVLALQDHQIKSAVVSVGLTIPSALIAPALYWLLVTLSGKTIDWTFLTLFTKNFWAGFDNLPMPSVGAHYFILSVLVAGVAIGTRFTVLFARSKIVPAYLNSAAIFTTFFSFAGLGSFGYFIGRSVVSTQLQIFLCFTAPVSLGLIVLLLSARRYANTPFNLRKVLVFLPIAVSLAAVVQAPDVGYEWRRVLPTTFEKLSSDPYKIGVSNVERALEIIESRHGLKKSDVTLAVENGNYISKVVGITNVSVLDHPTEAAILSDDLESVFCDKLAKQSKPILAEGFILDAKTPLCNGFSSVEAVSDNYWLVRY